MLKDTASSIGDEIITEELQEELPASAKLKDAPRSTIAKIIAENILPKCSYTVESDNLVICAHVAHYSYLAVVGNSHYFLCIYYIHEYDNVVLV